MSESPRYVTCRCQHCDGGIEFDANELAEKGSIIPCPHCGLETKLFTPPASAKVPSPIPPLPMLPVVKQKRASQLGKLTEVTIRARIKNGDTPLHRAAKTGRICEIPRHLLQTELFLAENNSNETPLHVAAKHGHLNQVPAAFLTRQTLTVSTEYPNKESRTGPTPPRTETPLHIAARCGHADQIPQEFLTPEFLSIEATGYRITVLHDLAYSKRLDLVPEVYANSEMWNLKDSQGRTPREALESVSQREAYVANVRSEPATEKQKDKLRWFGCTWDEGITKGQASDAIDECVRRFPLADRAYYGRPATDGQIALLRSYFEAAGDSLDDYTSGDEPLTYGEAKELIWECQMKERQKQNEEMDSEEAYWNSEEGQIDQACSRLNAYWPGAYREITRKEFAKVWALARARGANRSDQPQPSDLIDALQDLFPEFAAGAPLHSGAPIRPQALSSRELNPLTEAQVNVLRESGFRIDPHAEISAEAMDEFLKLEGQPAPETHMELFNRYGVSLAQGDAFSTYALTALIGHFEDLAQRDNTPDGVSIAQACVAANRDPSFKEATITVDQFGRVIFAWPMGKLKEWYRKGAA